MEAVNGGFLVRCVGFTAGSTLHFVDGHAGDVEHGCTARRRWLGQFGGMCGRADSATKPVLERDGALFFVIFILRVDF